MIIHWPTVFGSAEASVNSPQITLVICSMQFWYPSSKHPREHRKESLTVVLFDPQKSTTSATGSHNLQALTLSVSQNV